jgi:hypothetical protein
MYKPSPFLSCPALREYLHFYTSKVSKFEHTAQFTCFTGTKSCTSKASKLSTPALLGGGVRARAHSAAVTSAA